MLFSNHFSNCLYANTFAVHHPLLRLGQILL